MGGPVLNEGLSLMVVVGVAGEDVDVEVVVADVAENDVLEVGAGEVVAVEVEDLGEVVVGNGKVCPQLGELGVGLLALGDDGVDLLGDCMAHSLETLHGWRFGGNPCVVRVGTGA